MLSGLAFSNLLNGYPGNSGFHWSKILAPETHIADLQKSGIQNFLTSFYKKYCLQTGAGVCETPKLLAQKEDITSTIQEFTACLSPVL